MIEEFQVSLQDADLDMEEFIETYETDIFELFETGSVEVKVGSDTYLIAVVIERV
jgi:hypothetical protein